MTYIASRLRVPSGTSSEVSDIVEQVQRELDRIADDAQLSEALLLKRLFTAPTKPRTGMIVLADGTSWDPGAGAGFYGYYAAGWVKLG